MTLLKPELFVAKLCTSTKDDDSSKDSSNPSEYSEYAPPKFNTLQLLFI